MSDVDNGAAPAAPEGTAAPAAATPEVAQVQVVEPAKKSIEDTMSEVFDKMNPPRDEQQRFVAKDQPAETQETETQETTDQAQTETVEPPKAIDAPQSWSAEMKAKWASLPPEVQEYVLTRDRDAHQQISELGRTAKASEQLRNTIERFKPSFKGVDPAQAIERLVAASDFLDRSPADALKWLADAYSVDLSKLVTGGQPGTEGNAEVAQLRQTISQLQRQIAETSQRVTTREQREAETHQQSIAKLVEDFAKDKAYWADMESDIYAQIHAIRAAEPELNEKDTLQKAYDRALKLNDAVQAKITAEKKADDEKKAKAEAAKKAADAKKAASINVGRGANASPKPKGSWEQTMREVADRLMAS